MKVRLILKGEISSEDFMKYLNASQNVTDLFTNEVINEPDYNTTNDILNNSFENGLENNTPGIVNSSDNKKSLFVLPKGVIIGGIAIVGLLVVGYVYKKKQQNNNEYSEEDNSFDDSFDNDFSGEYDYDPGLYPVTDYTVDDEGNLSDTDTLDPNALWMEQKG